jgi:hypothetical protein
LASKSAVTVFAGLASKPVATVFSGLTSKLVATITPGLASKPMVGFLVKPQNQGGEWFPGLALKTCSSGLVIWASKSPRRFLALGLKTKRHSVASQNRRRDVGVGHASKFSGLLHVEACLARVSLFDLKTGGGAMMGGARSTIVEVASEVS